MMILLMFLMKLLSKSEEREPSLMIAQKLLVFRLRNPRRTSLKHPILTAFLLLLPREKEEKENPLDAASEAYAKDWDVEAEEPKAKKQMRLSPQCLS